MNRSENQIGYDIVAEVMWEQSRQKTLKAQGRFPHTCADLEMDDLTRLAVLTEEIAEVAEEEIPARMLPRLQELLALLSPITHVVQGTDPTDFADVRKELIQVAAVACAWVEAIDKATE